MTNEHHNGGTKGKNRRKTGHQEQHAHVHESASARQEAALRRTEHRLTKIEQRTAPISLETYVHRAPEKSGWLKTSERIAEVIMDPEGRFFCSVIKFVNPALESFAPWLASTIGSGYSEYLIRALKFVFIPDVPTTVAGNLVMGWLANPSDSLPESSVEATQNEFSNSGNINSTLELHVPRDSLEKAFVEPKFTRAGQVDGDLVNYDAGVFYVTTEGFNETVSSNPNGPQCVGYIEACFDTCFLAKHIPTAPTTRVFADNAEWTELLMLGNGVDGDPAFLQINNNNPAGVMLDKIFNSFYLLPGSFEFRANVGTVSSTAETGWEVRVQGDDEPLDENGFPPVFSAPPLSNYGAVIGESLGGASFSVLSSGGLLTNIGNTVVANDVGSTDAQYATNFRVQLTPRLGNVFPVDAAGIGRILIRRLPDRGPEGLDGPGAQLTCQPFTATTSFIYRMEKMGRQTSGQFLNDRCRQESLFKKGTLAGHMVPALEPPASRYTTDPPCCRPPGSKNSSASLSPDKVAEARKVLGLT